jgi:hypothetical protein
MIEAMNGEKRKIQLRCPRSSESFLSLLDRGAVRGAVVSMIFHQSLGAMEHTEADHEQGPELIVEMIPLHWSNPHIIHIGTRWK